MALNWTMLSPNRSPVPLPHEMTIRTVDSGVELTLVVTDSPPAGAARSGGSGGSKKLKEQGRLWLTDHRVIFVSDATRDKASFESLSVPLKSILSTKFEQPYLGSNYLILDIHPAAAGGLAEGTKAEVRFMNKGIFEFASALDKTRERALYMRRQSADEEEGLPSYSTPGDAPGPSSYVPASNVPNDSPPSYEA
ncbi:hypothetical protein BKA93DRAFT_116621 [Sparassis latifolia]|uniref:GRAM domain-containing protein n=1 Tax=Sparassis crispa TaxID=139825 RepID=A0A401GDA5_9APHY|nr:hypothetical protein SCP_0213720 [Sparassis crispa]GBE80166.1 hypothetical protein SCP_0213720 [Sparassis crispa]